MEIQTKIQDRQTAGILLARRITQLQLNNAIVVGVPHGGVSVASAIAGELNLPLEIMVCRKIRNPANYSRNIGSVSAQQVYLHDCPHSLPQDYLTNQIQRLRNEIISESHFYYGKPSQVCFEYKTVIVADDVLTSPDTLMACIKEIRTQQPLRIIVAVPFVEAEAARIIQGESDDFIFLRIQQSIKSPKEFYNDFSMVRDWDVKDCLRRSKGELVLVGA